MAQRAVILHYKNVSGTTNQGEIIITMEVALLQENSLSSLVNDIDVLAMWADSAAQRKSKIADAVIQLAQVNGYTELSSTDILIPEYSTI